MEELPTCFPAKRDTAFVKFMPLPNGCGLGDPVLAAHLTSSHIKELVLAWKLLSYLQIVPQL